MISLRLAIPAALVAAVLAGFFTYFVTARQQVEAEGLWLPSRQMLFPDIGTLTKFDQRISADDPAEAILKQAPDAKASAGTNELPIIRQIALPRRRLIGR